MTKLRQVRIKRFPFEDCLLLRVTRLPNTTKHISGTEISFSTFVQIGQLVVFWGMLWVS